MRRNSFITFLVIGILLGPSLTIVLNTSDSNASYQYQSYQLPYYYLGNVLQSVKRPNFVTLKSTYEGYGSVSSISIYNHSIYAFMVGRNSKYNLLELNMTNDFLNIHSSKLFPMSNFVPANETEQIMVYPKENITSYSRPYFDGSLFYTVSHEIHLVNGFYKINYYLISFEKNGHILAKNYLPFNNSLYSNSRQSIINFLGVYHKYIFIEDSYNEKIDIFAESNYTEIASIPFGLLINSNSAFMIQPSNYYLNNINIDSSGYLWFKSSTYYFIALSLNDILAHQNSNIKKTVKVNDFSNIWSAPFNLLDYVSPYYINNIQKMGNTGTFHNITVDPLGWEDSSIYAYKNELIYMQFLQEKGQSNTKSVLTGVSVNTFFKHAQNSDNGYTDPYKTISPTTTTQTPIEVTILNITGYGIITGYLLYEIIVLYAEYIKKNPNN